MNTVELHFPGGPVSLEGFAAEKGPTSTLTPWQLEPVELVFDALALASRIVTLRARADELADDVIPAAEENAYEYGLEYWGDAIERAREELAAIETELRCFASRRDALGALRGTL